MPFYTLAKTAQRVFDGTEPLIAIKEWVDGWNARQEASLYQEEPAWIDQDIWYWVNIWLAGAAEYAAFLNGEVPPAWTEQPQYFSRMPIVAGGSNARRYALSETPFAWRRRMLFSGRTTMLKKDGPAGF
jgi:hypothetical protein